MSNKQALLDCTFSWGKTCRLYRDSIEIAGKSYNLDDLTYIHPTYRKLFGVASARLELCFGLHRLTLRGIADPEAARQMVSHLRPYAEQSGPDTIAHRLRTRATQARELARVQAQTWERTHKLPALLEAPRLDAPTPSAEPAASPTPEMDETTPAAPSPEASSSSADAFDDFLDVAEQATSHIPANALLTLCPTSLTVSEGQPGLAQETCAPVSSAPAPGQSATPTDALAPAQAVTLLSSSPSDQAAPLTDMPAPDQPTILTNTPQAAPSDNPPALDQPTALASADLCSLPEQPTSSILADPAPAPAPTTSTGATPESADNALPQKGEQPAELPARPLLLKRRLPRVSRFEPPLRPVQLVNPRASLAQSAEASLSHECQAKAPSSPLTQQEASCTIDTQKERKDASLASEAPDSGEQRAQTSLARKRAMLVAESQKNMSEKKICATRSASAPALKSNLLPLIQVPVRLQPGECAHYSIEAALCSDRLASSQRASSPPLDHGLLILTNRRIFYLGKRCQLILAYTHLGSVSLLHNAIALHIEGQFRRLIMELEHPQEWADRIERLASIARCSPQLAPMFVLPGAKPPSTLPVTVKRAALKHPPAQEGVSQTPANPRITEAPTIELAPRVDQRIIETTTVEFAPDTDQNIVEATTITFGPRAAQSIVEATTIAFDLQAAQNIVEATTMEFGPQTSSSLAEAPTIDLGLHILDRLADADTLKFPPQAAPGIENQITSEFPLLTEPGIEHRTTGEFPSQVEGIENQVTDEFPPLPGAEDEDVATRECSPLAGQETTVIVPVPSREQSHYVTADTLKLAPGDKDEEMPPLSEGDEQVTDKSAALSVRVSSEKGPTEAYIPSLHEQAEDDATGKLAAILAHVQDGENEDERTVPLRPRTLAALSAHSLRPGTSQASERKIRRSSAQNRVLSRARFPQRER